MFVDPSSPLRVKQLMGKIRATGARFRYFGNSGRGIMPVRFLIAGPSVPFKAFEAWLY
jgi:hypothetical protein